jgi:hypothetical protein
MRGFVKQRRDASGLALGAWPLYVLAGKSAWKVLVDARARTWCVVERAEILGVPRSPGPFRRHGH